MNNLVGSLLFLASGFWSLAASYWLLASGFWSLASGFWLLAAGHWLLVSSIIQKILLQTKFMKRQNSGYELQTFILLQISQKPEASSQEPICFWLLSKILLQTKFMKPQKFQIRNTNIYLAQTSQKPETRSQRPKAIYFFHSKVSRARPISSFRNSTTGARESGLTLVLK